MELREGYKETEVGIIPEDWLSDKIGEHFNVATGSTPPTRDIANYGGDFMFASPADLGEHKLVERTKSHLSEKGRAIARCYPANSTLFTCIGSTIGKTGMTKEEATSNQQINAVFPSPNHDVNYVYYQLTYSADRITRLAGEQALPMLNKSQFEDSEVAFPPTITEEKVIAKVLSDTDKLIQALEQKIEKKKHLRIGTFQTLFAPKEGWLEHDLKDVCWFQEGPGLRNWQFTTSGMKVINVTNLVDGYLDLSRTDRHVSIEEFENMYRHFEIDEGDIVMASSGNSYAKVSVVRRSDLPLLMNTSVIRCKPLANLSYDWLLLFLKSELFKDQIDLLITGGAQPNFGPFHLNKIKMMLPPAQDDQDQISRVLIDMDKELELLNKSLNKYKTLKQGLMQQLLTGKTRLV